MDPQPTESPTEKTEWYQQLTWANISSKIILVGCAISACIVALGIRVQVNLYANRIEAEAAVKQTNGKTADFLAKSEAVQAISHLVTIMVVITIILVIAAIAVSFFPRKTQPKP